MRDLFTGLTLSPEDLQNIILHQALRHAFPGPPTAILHPGLLLALLVRDFPDPTGRSIRVPSYPRQPILRIIEFGNRGGHNNIDFVTTREAVATLVEENAVTIADETDNIGRDVLVLTENGIDLFREWMCPPQRLCA